MKIALGQILALLVGASLTAIVSSTPLDGVHRSPETTGKDGDVNVATADLDSRTLYSQQSKEELQNVLNSIYNVARNSNSGSRSKFTNEVVTKLQANNLHYNYIICCTCVSHTFNFTGVKDIDWGIRQFRWGTRNSGREYIYDIVVGGAGRFVRNGDGGFLNWAYKVKGASRDDVGRITYLKFKKP